MKLNNEQTKAVYQDNNHIFLLAGAGSGKTRVIIERIKYLLTKVKPSNILAITFTVKSSIEMKKRLGNKDVNVYTFHGYCYHALSQGKKLNIFLNNDQYTEEEILAIQNYKNSLFQKAKPVIYVKYQKYLNDNELLDFDDLIIEALKIRHKKYKYIFIDEFQDTNLLQYELIKKLNHAKCKIFAVGDPDQSIYKFRGAKVEIINQYIKDFNAEVLKLEENYRSKKEILTASNELIKHNLNRFKKTLFTNNLNEGNVNIYYLKEEEQNNHILNLIRKRTYKDIAILFRNHYQVFELKKLLESHYIYHVNFYSFHESKGLEFDTVIIYGAEVMPYQKEGTYLQEEEERRLLFVGMTRAKTNLLIYSKYKTKFLRETKIRPK
ncbi:ATP-dependent helicase [Acholeplasma hippikon]|nr:ATP-dependent helicase [Acholeplasma hippikon]